MMRFLLICLLAPLLSHACSRLYWNTNPIAKIAARTMDLYIDEHPMLVAMPRGISKNGEAGPGSITWKSKYGSVIVSAFEVASSDGINDQGLSAHLLYLHGSQYEPKDTKRPPLSNTKWVEYVLDNFKTVAEVVNSVDHFQIISTQVACKDWPLHLVIEDVSGDSAIFEYIKGHLTIHHGRQYTVVTNEPAYEMQLNNLKKYRYFGGTLPLPGDIDSVSRFVRVSAFLKTLPEPKTYEEAMAFAIGVIRTVQVPFGSEQMTSTQTVDAWPTRWITSADLTNKIYYFNATTSPNIAWVNLNELNLNEGAPILQLDLADPKSVGEVSKLFRLPSPNIK